LILKPNLITLVASVQVLWRIIIPRVRNPASIVGNIVGSYKTKKPNCN
jgi:hypothetical protein